MSSPADHGANKWGITPRSMMLPGVAEALRALDDAAGIADPRAAMERLVQVSTLLARVLVENNAVDLPDVAALRQQLLQRVAEQERLLLRAEPARPLLEAAAERDRGYLDSRYRFVSVLRRTIYGDVVLARMIAPPHAPVAIKRSDLTRIQPHMLEDPRSEAALMLEMSRHGRCNSVLLANECGYEGNMFFVVLDFCSGGEFFDIIAAHGSLAEPIALSAFAQLVDGLRFMHSCGLCHLDVSLENVLLRCPLAEGVRPVLIDFGMARRLPARGLFEANPAHKPGKVGYRAPEIWRGQPFDGRAADVYSLGVLLFIVLTGKPPFDRASPPDARFDYISAGRLADLLLRWGYNSVEDRPNFIDPRAVDLMQRMLTADPARRITLDEVAAHPWLQKIVAPRGDPAPHKPKD